MLALYPFPPLRWLCAALLLLGSQLASGQTNKPFKLHLEQYRGSIQWEQSLDRRNWSAIPNGTTQEVALQPQQTTYYRAKITEEGCSPVFSGVKAAYIFGNVRLSAKLIQGQVSLPAGSAVKLTDFTVRSLLDKATPNAAGSFELLVMDSTAEDLLILTTAAQRVLLLGTFYGKNPTYQLNSESTALALVMMYPWLRPVPTREKGAFVQAYRKEPEFATLTAHISTLVKRGGDLYDPANRDIATTVVALAKKSFNNVRQRAARPTVLDPVDMIAQGSSTLLLRNTTSYSYAVGIYRKKGNAETLVKKLMVAGSSLAESPWKDLIGESDAATQVSYDFAKAEQGEYLIKLRSGLAKDDTPEDEAAIDVNNRDLVISFFDNVVTNLLGLRGISKDLKECVDGMIQAQVGIAKIAIKQKIRTDAGAPTNQLLDVLLPVFSEASGMFGNCNIAPDAKDFLGLAFKQVTLLKNVIDAAPTARFFVEWPARAHTVDGCKFVFVKETQTRMVNCFTIEKNNALTDAASRATNYVCDTLTTKVRLREDTQYYPYNLIAPPIAGVDVFWDVKEGGGSLLTGTPAFTGRLTTTDAKGNTQVTWKLSDKPGGTQQATAQILNSDFTQLKRVNFITKAVVPKLKVITDNNGNGQTAPPSKDLPKPLTISLLDLADNLPVLLHRFDIRWEYVKGSGKVQKETSQTNAFQSAWTWTLGPEVGEQIVKATIVNRDCSPWQIESVTYTATATATCLPATDPKMQLLTGGGTKVWRMTGGVGCTTIRPYADGRTWTWTFETNGNLTVVYNGLAIRDCEYIMIPNAAPQQNIPFCLQNTRILTPISGLPFFFWDIIELTANRMVLKSSEGVTGIYEP
ncbi:hypothetical protein GCM10027346_41910 [Hymenobacter seoulensis]